VIRIMPAVIFRIATLADVQTRCGRLHPTFVKVHLSPSRNNPSPLSEITPDPKSTGAQHPKSLNTRPGFHHHRIGAGYPVSIGSSSAITGFYVDAAYKIHGFLRAP